MTFYQVVIYRSTAAVIRIGLVTFLARVGRSSVCLSITLMIHA